MRRPQTLEQFLSNQHLDGHTLWPVAQQLARVSQRFDRPI